MDDIEEWNKHTKDFPHIASGMNYGVDPSKAQDKTNYFVFTVKKIGRLRRKVEIEITRLVFSAGLRDHKTETVSFNQFDQYSVNIDESLIKAMQEAISGKTNDKQKLDAFKKLYEDYNYAKSVHPNWFKDGERAIYWIAKFCKDMQEIFEMK